MRKLVYSLSFFMLPLFSAGHDSLSGANYKSIQDPKTKESILQDISSGTELAYYNSSRTKNILQELEQKFGDRISRMISANLAKDCESNFKNLAAVARIELWEQPYIDAVDELLEKSKTKCTIQ